MQPRARSRRHGGGGAGGGERRAGRGVPLPGPLNPERTGEDLSFLGPASKPVRPSPRPPRVRARGAAPSPEPPRLRGPPPSLSVLFPLRPRPGLLFPGALPWVRVPAPRYPLTDSGSCHEALRGVCAPAPKRTCLAPHDELVARFSQAFFSRSVKNVPNAHEGL